MTVSELEQAMRNLISTQPMITVGPNGEVVSSLLAIIDIYKNFSFKVQTYPSQDAFKFGMMSEIQKLENDMCNYICQTMSSKGINLLLYSPQAQYGATGNSYNAMPNAINQNMVMGQMMYQMPNNNVQQYPQMVQQAPINIPNMPQYNGAPANMQSMPYDNRGMQQPIGGGVATPRTQRRPEPQARQPVGPMQNMATGQGQIPHAQRPLSNPTQPKAEQAPKASVGAEIPQQQPQQPSSSKPNPAERLMGGDDMPTGKAPGRDYLLELLKK